KLVEQRARLAEVRRLRAFGEPGMRLFEEAYGVCAAPLAMPQPAQRHRRAELPRFRALLARGGERLAERRLRARLVGRARREEERALEAIELRVPHARLRAIAE